jgi:putative colanic acid biosynthesis acetyltransferase WcaF
MPSFQNLKEFKLPHNFRGRSTLVVQLWWFVQATLFRGLPQVFYGFRRWLLRRFGACVGKGAIIRPSATLTYPWRIKIGDYSWIGDDVVVSQRSYLCAGTHDYRSQAFDIKGSPIVIEDKAWIAADVFVAPGVRVGEGAVVGARSSVFTDLPGMMVCSGSPARPVHPRI